MSKLPQLNLRIPDQHHDVIRQIAQRLRERDGDDFGARLTYFLNDQPAPAALGGDPALAGRMDALEHRLAELEQWRRNFLRFEEEEPLAEEEPPTDTVQVRAKINDPIPDAVLSEADRLNRAGMTWEDIRDRLKARQTANGLRNGVKKWRERQDREWAKGA